MEDKDRKMPKKVTNLSMEKNPAWLSFVVWQAIPFFFREHKTIMDWCQANGVNINTAYSWQQEPKTWIAVKAEFDSNWKKQAALLDRALLDKAMSGDVPAMKLANQIFHNWSEKLEAKVSGELTVDPDMVAKIVADKMKEINEKK